MTTVADVLERQSQAHPDDHAFVFLDEDETTVSYRELDTAARRVAAAIAAAGGSERPVLLLYPPGRAYVEGFLGCLYAGAIPVPAYPPDAHRLEHSLARLRNLVADCDARLALSVAGIVEAVPALVAQAPELAAVEWIATDTVPAADWTLPRPDPGSPALLQYTSGSTGTPKGVVLTHANLLHNAGLVQGGFGTSEDAVGVSWLPPYHDMGLIGGVLQPLFARFTTVLMSPLTFLQRPLVWLETISRYGATMSGGPNFAYDLCVRKSTADERAALDLSRWQLAFTGAEPVRQQTLDRFAEAFAPAGFAKESFYPCYGLAEATLIVTGGRPRQVGEHVGSGRALGDQRVAVVTDDTEQPDGTEGEIWVSGPSVARGYHGRPEETEQVFGARLAGEPDRTWLRTGDLGFRDPSGELVVTGRAKDLIIIRGRNVHPQDLEHLVEQVDGVRPGCSAAFATETGGEERVAVVCEVSATDGVIAGIRQLLAESAELLPASIVLLEPRRIPKTSSGKIQRHACRTGVEAGALDGVLERWDQGEAGAGGDGVAGLVAETLGLAEVAGDEALTRYGLDSLHAVELRAALEARFGVHVALSELLSGVTVDELAKRSAAMDATPAPPADAGVSPGVRALWFLQRWVPDSTAYHINRAARIRSALDVDALRRAFDALTARHPALRLRLPSPGGEPVAEYADPAAGVLAVHDVSGLDDVALQELVRRDSERAFDLATGPLFRAGLYSRGPEDHVLLLSLHHVVTDFWSLSIMVDDLLALYAGKTLPELPQPTRRTTGSDVEYWREVLDDTPAALDLPLAFARPKVQSFRGASHAFGTGAETLRRLDAFAEQAGVTRFVVVLAGYAALLARYAGEDVVIGTPTAGRDDAASTRSVGYFVNPVPLRVRVEPGITFRALVGQVRDTVLGALDHAVPFPQLVEALRPVRDPGRAPIMQTMLAMQQAPPGRADLAGFAVDDPAARIRLGDLNVQPYRLGDRGSAFDLSVHLGEVDGALSGVIEYCADLFDPATVAGLGRQLESLLAAVVADPDTAVAEHGLTDTGERAALLALADGGPPLEPESTLPALFARQTGRRPDATAVVLGEDSLTYAELDDRSDQLAAVLNEEFGVRRADPVGVYLPRGLDAVVAFWAVVKAGGCYLPLEPTLPTARVALLLADGQPSVVLTHRAMADRVPEAKTILLDAPDGDHWTQTVATAPSDRVPTRRFASSDRHQEQVEPGDLAYLLYTSGSTGRPKGVLVEHRGAANMAAAFSQGLGVTEDDRILQYSSCGFDISVMETLMAHLNGAALHLVPQSAVVPGPELAGLLADQRITAAVLTPSTVAALPAVELPDLTRLILGAEALAPDLVARWGRGRQVFNAYGPTEITVAATWTRCDPDDPRPPAIGRPIPGARSYVLDGRLEPVPVGVPGELYIGGVGVARGYLDQPELTGQRFVPDPNRAGERMYRTGDRVRWRPDGMLDFLGRLDEQVKVRGNRVEPAEVETRLRELLGLATVAVLPRQGPGGATELVAYLVSDRERLPAGRLRGMLRAELPEPYVPAAFVYLDALPTTISGKVDRRALPDPTPTDRGTATRRPPRTRTEQIVADVWADVLEQPSVGMDDHFFDQLGGHSLLVAKVASRLSDRIGRDVPVTHLFEHPTAAALARRLDGQQSEPADQATSQAMAQAAARRQALTRRRRSG